MADPTLPPHLREFDDHDKARQLIYDNALDALKTSFPKTDGTHRLELNNVRLDGKQDYTLDEQKRALISDRRLRTPVKGTWRLVDEASGQVLDERDDVVMHVPYYTQRGTIINNGNEYTVVNQQRLKPGVYTRAKESGEYEAQFNIKPGTGKGFRIWMEPSTGVFRVNVGQANIPAYYLLRTMGLTDEEMRKSWGEAIYQANLAKTDPRAQEKLYQRFFYGDKGEELSVEQRAGSLREALERSELDPDVVARTLGIPDNKNVSGATMLRATQKLLNISRGDEQPDDRNAPRFSNVLGVEDFVRERIEKDAGRTVRDILYRVKRDRNLQRVRAGALNPYMDGLVLGSGLAQPLEETNPMQLYEQHTRVTRFGEGGISSPELLTADARDVNPGQLGFVDLVAGPECFDAETEVLTARGWLRWPEVQDTDEFAQRDQRDLRDGRFGFLVYTKADRLVRQQYAGDLIITETDEISEAVTPNHRVYACSPQPQSRRDGFRFMMAGALPGMAHRYRLEPHGSLSPVIAAETARRGYYAGLVYCATVPYGMLCVRRAGKLAYWSGNSERIGADARLAFRTFKGNDRQMYAEFLDAKTGEKVYVRPENMDGKVIAFPGQPKDAKQVYGIQDGEVDLYPAAAVDLHVPSQAHMFAHGFNLTPMPTGFQPGRAFYASKYHSQWLPLVSGEAPLVQTQVPGEKFGFPTYYGRRVGSLSAPIDGIVTKVTKNGVKIAAADGSVKFVETVQDFPYNRVTAISYSPTVKEGDVVKAGDLVAHSDFTTKDGALAMGVNLKTAVVPYEGWSFEDAYTISESAAKRLATRRLYGFDADNRYGTEINRSKYVSLFPKKFKNDQLQKLDNNGVIRSGQQVEFGDPLILALGPRRLSAEDAELGRLHKTLRQSHKDQATVWENPEPGIVTDVGYTRSGVRVNVKTIATAKEGDKLANMEASKGIIGKIIKDEDMPVDSVTGEPFEMLFNPMTVQSRAAPNQLIELQLAKIARLTGQPMLLPSEAPDEGWEAYGRRLLAEHGLSSTTKILDPRTKRPIGPVSDGYMYISPFHHLADKKLCVSSDTEVLTRRGWVLAPQVNMNDEICTLNPETGDAEWQRPRMVRRYRHHGVMYRIMDETRDELVNSDHWLWVDNQFVTPTELMDELDRQPESDG